MIYLEVFFKTSKQSLLYITLVFICYPYNSIFSPNHLCDTTQSTFIGTDIKSLADSIIISFIILFASFATDFYICLLIHHVPVSLRQRRYLLTTYCAVHKALIVCKTLVFCLLIALPARRLV